MGAMSTSAAAKHARLKPKKDFILKLIFLLAKIKMVESTKPAGKPDEATINRAKLFLYKAV